MRSVIAATIVARNYLAQARVLAASFLRHHPGARFVTLVIDGGESDRTTALTAGEVCIPADLGIDGGGWEQMAGMYPVMEFATALKAALLRHLLGDAGGPDGAVCYLDPDIVVYRPFPEVFAEAARAGIALTPHVLHPVPRDGLEPDERSLMHSGMFNLGFICVGPLALPFLDWWDERLRVDAVVDLANALFTDQRWVDWVPALFGCSVLRDHGLNVAYWNAHERPLRRAGDGSIEAAGEPLKFFHFSGFDPDVPSRLSKHAGDRPRCRPADLPILAELCADYAESLRLAGLTTHRGLRYGLAATWRGVCLTPVVRSAYRTAVKAAASSGSLPPPAPFGDDDGKAFVQWLVAPMMGPPELGMAVWHRQLWVERPDLRAAFPDPGGADADRFRAWLDVDPDAQRIHDQICLPPREAASHSIVERDPTRTRPDHGWNVVGYMSAELGVGEAGRRMSLAIESTGISTELVAVSADASRGEHRSRRELRTHLHYRDSLFCVNADQLAAVSARTDDRTTGKGRRIGLWFWEVDRFPSGWHSAFGLVDEVWSASSFTTDALRAVSPIPVRTIPLPVWAPSAPTPFRRHHLGIPDGVVYLFTFDFHSVAGRKNPLGVLDAYVRAFGPDDGATLILKSINGQSHPVEFDRVRHAAADRRDIVVWDGYLDQHQVQALVELCDCYVSLHRAEGFGLGMAAAMAAGRPVIATGYSGNLEFMDDLSALLVPFDLVPVGAGMGPYPADAWWADPDLEAAAAHMRLVFDHPDRARAIGERGRRHVLARQSIQRASGAIGPLLMSAAAT